MNLPLNQLFLLTLAAVIIGIFVAIECAIRALRNNRRAREREEETKGGQNDHKL